jgi:hypothetical protein
MSNFAFEVFISYAQVDVEFARKLASWLRDCGFRVWFAEEQLVPGTSFRAGLQQGLRESCHLVAVLTKSYLQRAWTQREIDLFDLTADHTERRILALQIGDPGESSFDPVFQVYQRISWEGAVFDPAGFWLLYCGLSNQRPGASNEWSEKGRQLLFKPIRRDTDRFDSILVSPLISDVSSETFSPTSKEINVLVRHCLLDPYPAWKHSYSKLRNLLAGLDTNSIYDDSVLTPWVLGKAERAAFVSLALLPQILKHSAVWPFVDLYCKDIARWFLVAFSLGNDLASEMWFSWAISEQVWPFLSAAAGKVPDERGRTHFSHLARIALEPDVSFRDAESNYDYGVMITPWNHFHLCWLAIKLGDVSSAISHARTLCNIAKRGDHRAGRFLTRLSNWPCFQDIISGEGMFSHLEGARETLGLDSLSDLTKAKERIEEVWKEELIRMSETAPRA